MANYTEATYTTATFYEEEYTTSNNVSYSRSQRNAAYITPRDSYVQDVTDAGAGAFASPLPSIPSNAYLPDEGDEADDSLPTYDDVAGGARPPPKAFSKRWVNATAKVGWPVNKAANFVGAEGFWPSHMEKECNKAARILHSFTGLGFPYPPKKNAPMHPIGISKKSVVLIPTAVLSHCAGLAVFNVVRAGAIHGSLAGGSGVVVARRPDGTWSPPSSFLVSTIGGGFMIGLDIYECICVLNTREQLNAFTNPRFSLGGEASIALGPLGAGASLDAAISKTARPMWTYMKSRGIWAGIQIDGTIIITRPDCNAVFYNEKGISAKKILRAKRVWPKGGKALHDVLKCIDNPHAYNRLTFVGDAEEEDEQQQQQQQQQQQGTIGAGAGAGASAGASTGAVTRGDDKMDVKEVTEHVDEEFFADDPFAEDQDPFGDQNESTPPPATASTSRSRNTMTLLDGF